MNQYLPDPGTITELIEFNSQGRRVQGVWFHGQPNKPAPDTLVIFVHGVEHFWFLGPTMFLAPGLATLGHSTMGYNGAHSGLTFRLSTFEDAVQDIQDAIEFAKGLGARNIVLIGHSLGTPIIEYYAGFHPDSSLKGIAVLGPHVNLPMVTRESLLGPEPYEKFRSECRALVNAGRGEEIRILPYRDSLSIITSAKTFLSYRDVDGSKADVRPVLGNIKVPILAIYDDADNIRGAGDTTARSDIVAELKSLAVNATSFETCLIPSIPGNNAVQAHSFIGNEKLVVDACHRWLTKLV